MGFGKISSNELIQADIRHCINVAIHVDVYIFRPPVGSIIEGINRYLVSILKLIVIQYLIFLFV